MTHDPTSADWSRNRGRAILGIDPERRRNVENNGDRRAPTAPDGSGTAPRGAATPVDDGPAHTE